MITAWASVTGIIRAGFPVLLLSPRNSPPALADLLKATNCRMVVHSTDVFVKQTVAETCALLRESGGIPLSFCQLPGYSETHGRKDYLEPLPHRSSIHSDEIALISHTSGSYCNTNFPLWQTRANQLDFSLRIFVISQTSNAFT